MTKIQSKEIQLISVSSLLPHPKNMNIHKPEQIERLCKLIEYQGFRVPLVVQAGTNMVVAGHGRLEAAKKMKLKEVPVIYQEFDSEAQLYAFMVSDNAIAKDSWASLDHELILKEKDLFADLDIELLGFDDFQLPEVKELDEENEDTIPENVETRAKLGDIWQLGEHRLMCGDSTDILQVEKLMNGEKADMVFTDPPYGINFSNSSLPRKDFKGVREGLVTNNYNVLKNDNIELNMNEILSPFHYVKEIFVWGAHNFVNVLPVSTWICWDRKLNESADKNLCGDFDLCWSKQKHKMKMYRSPWYGVFGHSKTEDGHKKVHPTMKPVALIKMFLDDFSKPNNNIVDLFGGSGSTLIACEKTNRKCFMAELDPHYVDVILARWEKYTNKSATRLESNN